MSSPNSEGKRRRIFEELEQARSEFMRVEKLMVQIVNEAPGRAPLPDGQAQIVRAGIDAKQRPDRSLRSRLSIEFQLINPRHLGNPERRLGAATVRERLLESFPASKGGSLRKVNQH